MNKKNQNTDALIEEVLKNFFTDEEAKEFSTKFLQEVQPSLSGDKNFKDQFDVDLQSGVRTRSYIDLLITFAENKLPEEKFIDLLLYLGQSTIVSGEFATALDIHEKLARSSESTPKMNNIAANAFLRMGDVYSRQAQWELSFNYIGKADELFKEENDVKGNAECENLMGTIFGDKGELDKAVEHFEKSLASLEDEPDNALRGKIEINLGIISNIQSNYDAALSYFRRALFNFEKVEDVRRVAEV
ncbi:MAG: tetratricopeptide repeat protein, partial [Bacteroidetes bacterium]|nr:tetratricopeptide repeat protein [Bacteroidota bacterium]